MSDANKNESWGIFGCIAAVILAPIQWVQGWGRTKDEKDEAAQFRAQLDAIQREIDAKNPRP